MNIFISHSSEDFKVAEEVCNLLEEKGHKCFLAPRDIRSGYQYAEEIINGIERSDVMLILMSKAANQSPHVLREVERAVSKYIPLIVYKLEEVELSKSMEYFIMSHQWVSAHAGATHAQVVRCINQFERERDELHEQVEVIKEKGNKFLAVIGVSMILASILLVVAFYDKFGGRREEVEEKKPGVEQEIAGKEQEPEDIPVEEENIPAVEPGDTIVFGSYNGEPIEWRVLKVSANTNTAVIVSKHILTMKSFDVAESGEHTVELKYMPTVYRLGALLSIFAIIVFLVIIVIDFILKKTLFKRKPLTVAKDIWVLEDFDVESAPVIKDSSKEDTAEAEDSTENS